MRVTRVIVAATMLMGAAAPAWACELDGPGGHRFFAFANMYRGGQAEPPAQSREQPAPAKSEESERDRQGGNGGSDPAGSNPSGSAPQDAAPSR
jgi:hypothetical protein